MLGAEGKGWTVIVCPSSPYKKPVPPFACLMLIQNFSGYPFHSIDTCHIINKEGQTIHKMDLEFQVRVCHEGQSALF